MHSYADCDVIVRQGSYEVVATGRVAKVSGSALAAAGNWCAASAKARPVIGVEGFHGPIDICGKATSSKTIRPAVIGGMLPPLEFVGLEPEATIGGCTWWKDSGDPGPMRVANLNVQTTSPNKALFLAAQHLVFPRLAVEFEELNFIAGWTGTLLQGFAGSLRSFWSILTGNGPIKGPLWIDRKHGSVHSVRMVRCKGDGFGEHGPYVCNVQKFVEIVQCYLSDTGRTGVQICNRQWEDKAQSIATQCPSTPETAHVLLEDNLFANCSSYMVDLDGDGDVDQIWANGSAITIAGFPGSIVIRGNRVVQTHAGGGALAIWSDAPKVGTYKTFDGYANGDVLVEGNLFDCLAGAKAGRESVMIGNARSLDWKKNRLVGTERRIALNHTGPIGKVTTDSILAAAG